MFCEIYYFSIYSCVILQYMGTHPYDSITTDLWLFLLWRSFIHISYIGATHIIISAQDWHKGSNGRWSCFQITCSLLLILLDLEIPITELLNISFKHWIKKVRERTSFNTGQFQYMHKSASKTSFFKTVKLKKMVFNCFPLWETAPPVCVGMCIQ